MLEGRPRKFRFYPAFVANCSESCLDSPLAVGYGLRRRFQQIGRGGLSQVWGEEGLSYAWPLPHRRKAKDMINQIISRGGDPSQLNDGHVIVELMVPGPRVGLVIGKGGETIRGLQVGRLVTRPFAGPARHCASMVPEIRRKLISNWCCWAPTFATQVGVPIEHS